MHALAAGGSVDDADLGRPVNPDGVARLTELAWMIGQPTEAPGLVVAALVHAEIIAAGAFGTHNGVVGRAAERLVMVSKGVDPGIGHGAGARARRRTGWLPVGAGGVRQQEADRRAPVADVRLDGVQPSRGGLAAQAVSR